MRQRAAGGVSDQGRSLAGACLAHMLHDGYTDLLYVLLPVWQKEFGLSFSCTRRGQPGRRSALASPRCSQAAR